jgi:hypothetical protein
MKLSSFRLKAGLAKVVWFSVDVESHPEDREFPDEQRPSDGLRTGSDAHARY